MRCARCQHENDASAKFCEECAAPLPLACAGCGRRLSPTAKFCPECARPTSLAAPKYLAERIRTSRAILEGERKHVTVLFADMKGSMEFLAQRDPEEARTVLDPVLERMMDAVHHYEGTVNQVLGDGIMALFGAPLAHEDHAVRACYAALRMQDSLKRYAETARRTLGVDVQIRVGLNSGEVVVRAIGSDLHMDYSAIGQTTHLAARMEQLAMPGTILIPDATLKLVEGHIAVNALGPRSVKGLDGPIDVYEVIGGGAARSRIHAAAARGLTRFVGRTAELDQLRQALERARGGHGQIVAVVGEPGVGKSRLYWEFTRARLFGDALEGWMILEARPVSYDKASSYRPVIDLLTRWLEIDAADDAPKIREKVLGKLASLDEALRSAAPALLALVGADVDDPTWQSAEPPQRRQRTLDAIKRVLLRQAQTRPLLLILEDLHWIDDETQAVLDVLVESMPAARLLLLVNYRPEYRHGWGNRPYYVQVRVEPLQRETAEDLLDHLLGSDGSVGPLKRLLIERTEGNPFFIEESVRMLVETGVLAGPRGACHLVRPIDTIRVPASVHAILAARIDRLAPEDKELLQAAAVVGEDVPLPVLRAVADVPDETLQRGLAHLRSAEFLDETRLFPELEYTFKHGLTYQVAYGSLLHDRRRALHARIVHALEQLGADRRPEHAERLAHHALRGELWESALTYLRVAGNRAIASSANRQAIAYFEQALHAVQHLEGRARIEQEYDFAMYRVGAWYSLGELGRAVEYLRDAEALARALDDQTRLARVAVLLLGCLAPLGDQARAIESGERGLAFAEGAGNTSLRVAASILLGFAYCGIGDFPPAIRSLRTGAALLKDQPVHKRLGQIGLPAVFWRAWIVPPLAELGAFAEARAHGADGLAIAETVAQPYSLALMLGTLGLLHCVKGEPALAIAALTRSVDVCRDHEITLLGPFTTATLGYAYALSGELGKALPLMEQGIGQSASLGLMWWQSRRMVQLGEGYLFAGRMNDALDAGERALALAETHGERASRPYALRLIGELAFRRDPPQLDLAEHQLLEAVALGDALGMRPLVARCQLDLSRLYARTADRVKAREQLTAARGALAEMAMCVWLEQADAELKRLA